ncbi:hypothetical protein AB0O91_37455 [Kitasatospora sp. NPDC089797]|uniref:hypothetical protein n=1 Tax=Kitasatospora sp. NPDC089797 TaxID=3155298 RepID=UPI0034393965
MQARKPQETAGRPRQEAGATRRAATRVGPGAGVGSPGTATDLQRTVGNAATGRMIADRRGRAGAAVQRVPDPPAARQVRPELTVHNVAARSTAGTFDGERVTPGPRAGILRRIVWQDHLAAISEVCRKHKYTIAVRETGVYSIKRIGEGAKAKPHTILEKSIKPGSVEKKYQADEAERVLNWLKDNDLSGFVGHWGPAGLLGVRIDNPPGGLHPDIVHTGTGGEPYVPIDMTVEGGGEALELLKADPRWKQYLYTGDYDLHEAYSAQGGTSGGQIPEATREKVDLLNRLNAGIGKNAHREPVARTGSVALEHGRVHKQEGSDHAMFQHGDQATYRMNQYLESEVARHATQLIRAVATESDEPLAWCRMGQWYVTRDKREHALLREAWGLKVPHTWGDAEVDRTEAGGYHTTRYTG